MLRQRLLISVRSIPTGWVTLLLITYLLERPLLLWTAPILGGSWFPTVRLAFDCCAFAATGWIIGYWSRADALFAVLVFAATLTVWDFDPVLAVNVPWLFRLVADEFHDNRYLGSLVATAASHALLFGSLVAGGLLARPAQTPVSIFRAARR